MPKDELACFTIGHSNYPIEDFISLLKKNNINCVLDIRSTPYSKFASQFDREGLKFELSKSNIIYGYMGKELGARHDEPDFLFPDGKVNFSKVRTSKLFEEGIMRVIEGIKKGYKIALMCSEKEPFECHRFGLVSYGLKQKKVLVNHILEDGSIIPNDELEERLLNVFEKNRNQLSLFEPLKSKEEALEKAYEKHNKEIGYSIKEEDTK